MNALTKAPARNSLEPSTLQEAMAFAGMLARSSMVPKDFQGKPENCIVAIQWGREIGLGPLQALQNIAVINGRPSVWGDAMIALVRGSGICAYIKETIEGEGEAMTAWCRTARKGEEDSPTAVSFSVADAKKAGLWGKSGPWQQHPKRMLQLRARGFALRDCFPDVLRGVISAEEAQDMPADAPPPFRGTTLDARIEPFTTAEHIGDEIPARVMDPPKRTFLEKLRDKLIACTTEAEVFAVGEHPAVKKAMAEADDRGKDEIGDMLTTALDRVRENEMAGAAEPEGLE